MIYHYMCAWFGMKHDLAWNLFLQASKTKKKTTRMIQDQSSTTEHLYDHEREYFVDSRIFLG